MTSIIAGLSNWVILLAIFLILVIGLYKIVNAYMTGQKTAQEAWELIGLIALIVVVLLFASEAISLALGGEGGIITRLINTGISVLEALLEEAVRQAQGG